MIKWRVENVNGATVLTPQKAYKGRDVMRKMKVLTLCFLIMTLCGCEFMKGNSSSEVSTEIPSEPVTSESDGINEDWVQEEFPFDDVTEVSCQQYDENNILGLKAIYVGDHVLAYCFLKNDIWRDYKEANDKIDVCGLDEFDCIVNISNYVLEESDHFFWVRIERDGEKKAVGFGLNKHSFGYSVNRLTDPQLIIQDIKHNELQKQTFKDNQWGEIVNYQLDLSIQPN